MSTSYLSRSSRTNYYRPKPISSASLDALMSSPNSSDNEKSKSSAVKISLNRTVLSEDTKRKLNHNAPQFIPSQLYKVKSTQLITTVKENGEGSSSETRTSTSSECRHSDSLEISTSSDTRSSTSTSKRSIISFETSATISAKSGSFNTGTPNTSLYITPGNTPSSLHTSDQRSRSKRSLSDQYMCESGQSTPNSSLNSTAYYTADSSIEYGSSIKRFKTRWTDSRSSLKTNDSSYLNESYSSVASTDSGFQPELIGYQMIGDSQFCRFGQQLLGLQKVPMPNCPGRIGICVSGQTITDLHRRVKEKFYPISDKIILMIGTNDFLRNTDVTTMCNELSALIKTLQETVTNIVLLTLPPIPKLEKKQRKHHFMLLDQYNSHIRSLENGEKVRIADVSPVYMSSPPYQRCRMQLFEVFFSGPARRFDMIHLNRHGLEVIRKYILDHFL